MKSMNIAASGNSSPDYPHIVTWWRWAIPTLPVAAVVLTAADSRSSILALLKRTGFHLLVFMITDENLSARLITALISGNAQNGWH